MALKNDINLHPNLVAFKRELKTLFPKVKVTSEVRPGARTRQGKVSRHASGEAIDLHPDKEVGVFLNSPEGISLLNKYDLGFLDETLKGNEKYGEGYHIGFDSQLVSQTKQRARQLQLQTEPQKTSEFSYLPNTQINTNLALPYVEEEETPEEVVEAKDTLNQKQNYFDYLSLLGKAQLQYVPQIEEQQQEEPQEEDVVYQDGGQKHFIEAFQEGGVIKDDNGYWNPNNWGKTVEIDQSKPNSFITMEGVFQPLIGISKETGEQKVMLPGKKYRFKDTKSVIEKPIKK